MLRSESKCSTYITLADHTITTILVSPMAAAQSPARPQKRPFSPPAAHLPRGLPRDPRSPATPSVLPRHAVTILRDGKDHRDDEQTGRMKDKKEILESDSLSFLKHRWP